MPDIPPCPALRADPAEWRTSPAELLDGGPSATLTRALGESGGSLGEAAFEHGLHSLIDGTATALCHLHEPRDG
jgi:hypothetical protein